MARDGTARPRTGHIIRAMARERIRFSDMDWQPGAVHPLERKKSGELGGATMLEFAAGFADPVWCKNGHAGYVLDGSLGFEFEDGREIVVGGEGFVIDAGTPHRAYNAGDQAVRLFIAPRG